MMTWDSQKVIVSWDWSTHGRNEYPYKRKKKTDIYLTSFEGTEHHNPQTTKSSLTKYTGTLISDIPGFRINVCTLATQSQVFYSSWTKGDWLCFGCLQVLF